MVRNTIIDIIKLMEKQILHTLCRPYLRKALWFLGNGVRDPSEYLVGTHGDVGIFFTDR